MMWTVKGTITVPFDVEIYAEDESEAREIACRDSDKITRVEVTEVIPSVSSR